MDPMPSTSRNAASARSMAVFCFSSWAMMLVNPSIKSLMLLIDLPQSYCFRNVFNIGRRRLLTVRPDRPRRGQEAPLSAWRDNELYMRKRIVQSRAVDAAGESDGAWLHLNKIATVEVTSEREGFPIEAVFAHNGGPGWRAARAGRQVIRIIFDEPVAVGRIRLRFEEKQTERTQEFTLSWCPAAGGCREIVRQQWNFSPGGSTSEIEDYAVSLEAVSAIELQIEPDIAGKDAVATLAMWRVAGPA